MTACNRCTATWTGLRIEHCTTTSRVGAALWPAALAGPDLHPRALERTPYGTGVGVEILTDQLRAEPLLVKGNGSVDVDALESGFRPLPTALFGVVKSVLLGGQDAKIRGVVVRAISIDMVDLHGPPDGAHHEAMLVALDVLSGRSPAKPDVPLATEVSSWRPAGRFLVGAERPNRHPVGTESKRTAGVAAPTLASGPGNGGVAVNAGDVHDLIIQWSCHQTFTGSTAGDMHRVGDHAINEGPDRRRCLTAGEMVEKGMAQNERGVWTTGRNNDAWWAS